MDARTIVIRSPRGAVEQSLINSARNDIIVDSFDYVIVGGGSAASVLANRLTAAGVTVCVLEAGPTDRNPFIHMPAGFVKTLHNPAITWRFETDGTEWTAGRRIPTTQGRTLGGSGSVNGMVFVRGQEDDYNDWAHRGNQGWGYGDVLPYFKSIERRVGPADERSRGRTGELPVTDPLWRHPLCDAFIAGAHGLGFARDLDYNASSAECAGYYQRVIEGERRVSAARAFLYPAMRRDSLSVRTQAQATAIMLGGRRATGVRYVVAGDPRPVEVQARREVILCAGTVNTPKLLQLSGIGPAKLLQDLRIAVRHALPGVGENLSDHYSPRIVIRAKNTTTINNLVRGPRLLKEGVKWLLRQPSVLGLSAAIAYAFGKSDPRLPTPDCTVIFTPASYRGGKLGSLDTFPGMTCGAWQMRPESKGYVQVRSTDPAEVPVIQPNYLSSETDRRVLLAAIRMARRILATPSLAAYSASEEFPGASIGSDDELLDFARQQGSSCYHLVGTCRMGPSSDPTAVVDDQLRVRGIEGLRIADASIMPTVTSGNTYAPTLMIGAKAADLILGHATFRAEVPATANEIAAKRAAATLAS
jgi:choline dehydrogenase